jgi:mono/diheme cytochrome c family protein
LVKIFEEETMSRLSVLVIGVLMLAAAGCGSSSAAPDPNAPKPSNAGGVGEAVTLQGDAANGEQIFATTCAPCHGPQGTGSVLNDGAEEPEVPALNPIEDAFKNSDTGVFAANLDLFLEHGSTPAGTPSRIMMAYGDNQLLTPQQIADVIAYIISLNK